jgi:hypothetical protein
VFKTGDLLAHRLGREVQITCGGGEAHTVYYLHSFVPEKWEKMSIAALLCSNGA